MNKKKTKSPEKKWIEYLYNQVMENRDRSIVIMFRHHGKSYQKPIKNK